MVASGDQQRSLTTRVAFRRKYNETYCLRFGRDI